MPMGYGVIGSTTDSGSVSLGSSPGTPARGTQSDVLGYRPARKQVLAPSSSGLGRRPLKAVARVRIPSGLQDRGSPVPASRHRGSFRVSCGALAPHPKPGGASPPWTPLRARLAALAIARRSGFASLAPCESPTLGQTSVEI